MRWMYWCTSSWGASSFIEPWIQIESRCRCRIGPSSEKYTSGRVAGSVRAMARYTSKRASFGRAAQAFSRVARASAGAIIPRRAATAAPMAGSSPGSLRPCACTLGALGRRAVQPVRRNVRRIGLQHQRVQRQCRGQAAQLQRALEGHRAAETQPQAELQEPVGLLRTAGERMRDASPRPRPPGRHAAPPAGGRPSGAHAGSPASHAGAPGAVVRGRNAPAARAWPARTRREQNSPARSRPRRRAAGRPGRRAAVHPARQIAVRGAPHVQGVDAQRVTVTVGMRRLAHGLEVGHLDRGIDTVRHPAAAARARTAA
jgi:hypothetical protein